MLAVAVVVAGVVEVVVGEVLDNSGVAVAAAAAATVLLAVVVAAGLAFV